MVRRRNKLLKAIKILNAIFLIGGLLSLSACISVYASSFGCGDAKGLDCQMMSEIDKKIDNGSIDEVDSKNKRRGKKITKNQIRKKQTKRNIYANSSNLDCCR